MKSVLISIQPKWVEKICHEIGKENGKPIYEKVVEVRKSRPKIETPFKCYIYCTIGNGIKGDYLVPSNIQCGKVIGKFVCDSIICSQAYFDSQGKNHLTNIFEEDIKRTCLTEYELWNYIAGKAVKANQMYDGYLWHIAELEIYDKPKELHEFRKYSEWLDIPITRPPQSWCYVESLGE